MAKVGKVDETNGGSETESRSPKKICNSLLEERGGEFATSPTSVFVWLRNLVTADPRTGGRVLARKPAGELIQPN